MRITTAPARSTPSRLSLVRRPLTIVLVLSGLAALSIGGAVQARADAPAQTVFVDTGFTGASAGTGYTLPSTPNGTNKACLTGGTTTAASASQPIPGCVPASPDADGTGALRLTTAATSQSGGVGATSSVPITKGLDATFDSYQYAGQGLIGNSTADGISFYLAATDPYAPSVPTQIGQLGGSLGYSANSSGGTGLAHGYLGIGLDVYGNYLDSGFQGSNCSTAPGRTINNVTVRGPGDGAVGYCIVSSTQSTGGYSGTLNSTATTRSSAIAVPVEVLINPTATDAVASSGSGITIPAHQFAVAFTPLGGTQQILRGALPSAKTDANMSSVIPAGWIDPTTGYPYKLTYGWAASTGGSTDVHEVNYLRAQTVSGPVPALSVATSGAASVVHDGSGVFDVTPTVTTDGGSETQPLRATTTFPAGITPTDGSGHGWTCTVSGQTETCQYPASASSPIAPGTALPKLSLPYTVSGAARTATISTIVASTDTAAVTQTGDVTIGKEPVSVSVSNVTGQYGSTQTFVAAVSSAATNGTTPTGTVTFTDSTTGSVLCTSTLSGGTASCGAVLPAPVGTHTVVATYDGDAQHLAGGSTGAGNGALTVTKASTTPTLTISPSDVVHGTASTLTVSGLSSAATGTVSFQDADGTVLCAVDLATATSCDTPALLSAGMHSLTAHYSGDSLYAASVSAAGDLTVEKASSTLGTPPSTTPTQGTTPTPTQAATHGTATKLTSTGLPKDATGTITFATDDGTVLCTATLPTTSCDTPMGLAGGTYTVHSTYSGDDNYEPTSGTPFTLVVAPEAVDITVASSSTHTTTGTATTFTVHGLPSGATGVVRFVRAGVTLCQVTLPATSCTVAGLNVGSDAVTAEYSGDASYAVATGQIGVTVDPAAVATSQLAFTGSTIAVGAGIASGVLLLAAGLVLIVGRRMRRPGQSELGNS